MGVDRDQRGGWVTRLALVVQQRLAGFGLTLEIDRRVDLQPALLHRAQPEVLDQLVLDVVEHVRLPLDGVGIVALEPSGAWSAATACARVM